MMLREEGRIQNVETGKSWYLTAEGFVYDQNDCSNNRLP